MIISLLEKEYLYTETASPFVTCSLQNATLFETTISIKVQISIYI